QANGNPPPSARHVEGDENAERHLDRKDNRRKYQVAGHGLPETFRGQQLLVPANAVPEELVVAESVLYGVVDDRHQRDDRRKRDQDQHWKDEEPGLVVPGLFHRQPPNSTRQESA